MVVEHSGSVERPARLPDLGWGVGPAVEDEQVLSADEVDIRLRLHIERRGTEDRRVEPGERFARTDIVAENMVGGGSPTQRRELPPEGALSFGQSREPLAGEADCRFSICLRTKFGVVRDRPIVNLRQVVLVDQLREGLSPVMANGLRGGGSSGHQFGQMRQQIVTATALELCGKVCRPIRSIGFQGIGKNSVGWSVAEGPYQRFAGRPQVRSDGLVAEGVEHPALRAHGRALDHLPSVAGDKEEGDASRARRSNRRARNGQRLGRCGVPLGARQSVDDRGGDEAFPCHQRGRCDGRAVSRDGNFGHAQSSGRFIQRGGRAAVGPAAPHGHVDPQPKLAPFLLSVVHAVKHLPREERIILETPGRVVEHLWVDKCKLGSADAVRFHLLHFAQQLTLLHCDAKPPPSDHRARFSWRVLELLLEICLGEQRDRA